MTQVTAPSTRGTEAPRSVIGLAPPYRGALASEGKSPRTVETYLDALSRLDAFLVRNELPRLVALLRPDHLQAFIADVQRNQSAATAIARYRALQSFFRWCEASGAVHRSPMADMRAPAAASSPKRVVPRDSLDRLVQACEGRGFRDLRDTAMVRLFIDTGLRRGELATLRIEDVDLLIRRAAVTGRAGAARTVAFSETTARSIERYLSLARAGHPDAESSALWLGHGGPMTGNGIYQAIEARTVAAGLERIHPHQFRQFAHEQRRSGRQARGRARPPASMAQPSRSPDAPTPSAPMADTGRPAGADGAAVEPGQAPEIGRIPAEADPGTFIPSAPAEAPVEARLQEHPRIDASDAERPGRSDGAGGPAPAVAGRVAGESRVAAAASLAAGGRVVTGDVPPSSVHAIPTAPEDGADGEAHRTSTLVVATGLVSVPSVARFKRQLAQLAGVRWVSVSSGSGGTMRFEVAHDPVARLRDQILTLVAFGPRVVGGGEGIIEVQVRDPAV